MAAALKARERLVAGGISASLEKLKEVKGKRGKNKLPEEVLSAVEVALELLTSEAPAALAAES